MPLQGGINTSENEGAQNVSQDGTWLFFTGCYRPDGYGSCDIYFTKRNGNEWSEVKDVGPPVCTAAWETQPCISSDGNSLNPRCWLPGHFFF